MLIKRFEKIHAQKKESLLLISHQEKIIRMADSIMVISGGKLERIGSRDEILPTLFQGGADICTCRQKGGDEFYEA